MSSEDAKKRKREDGGADDEGASDGVVDVEKMMAEMKAQMERAMESRLGEMQNKIDGMKNDLDATKRQSASMQKEMDEMKNRLSYLDELERKCESLERSMQILTKDVKWKCGWKYSARDIPASHWIDRGFDEDYIEGMERFLWRIKDYTCELRSGACGESICLGGFDGGDDTVLLHDDALLPHWQEFANALQLYQNHEASHNFGICNLQLPSSVMDLLTPALRDKPMIAFELDKNDFANAREGIAFAVEIMESNQKLTQFGWTHSPIESMDDATRLVEVVIGHPTIEKITLENCFGENRNGYDMLCLLLVCNKEFSHVDLETNNIRTGGGTEIADFLTSNPPLRELLLRDNHLDDNDAILIAGALKRNTNLRDLRLGQNDITDIGHAALRNAVFDSTNLNAVADCNHTCCIDGLNLDYNNDEEEEFKVNRGSKIFNLLSSRNREGTNVHHLDAEFGDESLKLVPKVLECIHIYAGNASSDDDDLDHTDYVHPL